jgi:hypothetical protein
LGEVYKFVGNEPWGAEPSFKVLELYLRANFEIAKEQQKVYEDKDRKHAFWRAGKLVNMTSDPLWLCYVRNTRDNPPWKFDRVVAGPAPGKEDTERYQLTYDPPEFTREWDVSFPQANLEHMLEDDINRIRLERVFASALRGEFNPHLAFRAIYGEIQLKRKEEVVIPTWYGGGYQFLMPLYLTQSSKVELTAALHPNPPMRRYEVRTLLLPPFAYAHARAVVKSRAHFANWLMLSDEEINTVSREDEEATELLPKAEPTEGGSPVTTP